MEIQVEVSEVNAGYLQPYGRQVGIRKTPGRMVRLPPKRGAIKKQIFAYIGHALAEVFKILSKKGARLSKQVYYQIMAIASMYLCKNVDSNNSSSLVESMKKLL